MALSRPILVSLVVHAGVFVAALGVVTGGAPERQRSFVIEVERSEPAPELPAEEQPREEAERAVEEELTEVAMEEAPDIVEAAPEFAVDAFTEPQPAPVAAEEPFPRQEPWLARVREKREKEVPLPQPVAPPAPEIVAIPGRNPPPDYPAVARRRQWEGRVLLAVEVGSDGRVVACRTLRSSGYAVLDEAAVAAVRRWEFRHGPGKARIPVRFVLRRG